MRVFAPVIVRGEEEKGVRLWEFGKEIYLQLLGIAEDEDYGDYTDVNEGRDFTVEAVRGEIAGRQGLKTSIRVKPKTTPLSDNAALVEQFLTDQPSILEIQRKRTYDELKEILQTWLSPEEPEEGAIIDDEDDEVAEVVVTAKPGKAYTINTPPTKVSKAEKFESLFEDDDNDLPF